MHHTRPRGRLIVGLAVAAVSALALAGCADQAPAQPASSASDDLLSAATAAAKKIVDGKDVSGTVTIVSTLSGQERERWLSALTPFEDATGVKVEYTGTGDYSAVIQAGVESGNPPDIISVSPALVRQYAKAGDLAPLPVDDAQMRADFGDGLADSTSVDGTNYGVFTAIDNYMVWYNPSTYDGPTDGTWNDLMNWSSEQAAAGSTPWCVGAGAGGWPVAYMIANQLVKSAGPEVVNGLGDGSQKWDSDPVRAAFESVGQVVTNDAMIPGGVNGALTTEIDSVATGLYSSPQRCQLLDWGTYAGAILLSAYPELDANTDLDFFPIPAASPEFSKYEGYTGTAAAAFTDRPEVQALMQYLATPEYQSLIAATGNWTPPNVKVPESAYPNDIAKKVASELVGGGKELVALPFNTVNRSVTEAFYAAVVNWMQNPSTLEQGLQSIDAAQANAAG